VKLNREEKNYLGKIREKRLEELYELMRKQKGLK